MDEPTYYSVRDSFRLCEWPDCACKATFSGPSCPKYPIAPRERPCYCGHTDMCDCGDIDA